VIDTLITTQQWIALPDDQNSDTKNSSSSLIDSKQQSSSLAQQQLELEPFTLGEISDAVLAAANEQQVPLLGLCFYASEGDNSMEAMILASIVVGLLTQLDSSATGLMASKETGKITLRPPASWTHMFGGPIGDEIYA
jgi:hypothetical protein